MKKSTIILLYILFNISANAQTIPERLDSPDYSIRLKALFEIRDNNLTEYSQDLLDRIFEQPTLFLTHAFIDVLYKIGYLDIIDEAYQFIDLCDQFPQEQPLYHKVKATEILVGLDDFSTVNYVFEYINQDTLEHSEMFIELLKDIAIKIPSYSETIKYLLIIIKDNSEFYLNRRYALEYLIELFGENTLKDEILSTAVNDSNSDMRKFAMDHYNFPDRKDLLMQQIQNDTDWFRRRNYTEIFLNNYAEPSDLKFIKDYQLVEPDENAGRGIKNQISGFVPPKPVLLNWSGMIVNLISYTTEMFQYGWITNTQTKDYYISKLNLLKRQIESGRYQDACATVNNDLLSNIENDLEANYITIEGRKFLHYHCVYIKQDFSQTVYPCQ